MASKSLIRSSILRASLLVSYHGDGEVSGKEKAKGGVTSPKRAKGNKKKGAANASSGQGSGNDSVKDDVPTARPASPAEAIAWNARADWLESELRRTEKEISSAEDLLKEAIAKLDEASKENDAEEASGALTLAKSQLLLQGAAANDPQNSRARCIAALESLPPAARSCPGTKVTLASLYASSNNDNDKGKELLSSLGDDVPAKMAAAAFHIEGGRYADAAELLEGIVKEDPSSMEATALLVKALRYTDPSAAEEYVGVLQEANAASSGGRKELDGEALESMDVPRFAKRATGGSEEGSSRVRKMIAATGGGKRGSAQG